MENIRHRQKLQIQGQRFGYWFKPAPPNEFRIKAANGIRKNKHLQNPEKFGLINSIRRIPDVFAFAVRTTTRAGEPLSFYKNKSAFQTLGRYDNQFFSLSIDGTRNMRKMPIDFFFPNAQGL